MLKQKKKFRFKNFMYIVDIIKPIIINKNTNAIFCQKIDISFF